MGRRGFVIARGGALFCAATLLLAACNDEPKPAASPTATATRTVAPAAATTPAPTQTTSPTASATATEAAATSTPAPTTAAAVATTPAPTPVRTNTPASTPVVTQAPPPPPPAPTPRPVSSVTVPIANFAYGPASGAAPLVVTWVNSDVVEHDVVQTNGSLRSPIIPVGGTFTARFDSPGTISYMCSIHAFMVATVEVR